MKKKYIMLFSILFLVFIIFWLFKENSFSLSLIRSGLHSGKYDTIIHSFDSSDKYEYKVIKTGTNNSDIALAILRKNKLGFWKVSDCKISNDDSSIIKITWITSGGAKSYNLNENSGFEQELHIIYYGNNAIKLIKFLPNQIPPNTTINIRQAGKVYMIHVISFSTDLDIINNFDMKEILIKNDCIPAD